MKTESIYELAKRIKREIMEDVRKAAEVGSIIHTAETNILRSV